MFLKTTNYRNWSLLMNKYKKNSDISSHTNNVIRYTEIMIIIFTSKLPCFKTQIKQPVSKLKNEYHFFFLVLWKVCVLDLTELMRDEMLSESDLLNFADCPALFLSISAFRFWPLAPPAFAVFPDFLRCSFSSIMASMDLVFLYSGAEGSML